MLAGLALREIVAMGAILVAAAAGGVDVASNETGIRQTDLFVAGDWGYHTYRIPAIVVTAKGTVLAFCEGRKGSASDSGDIDLLLRRSLDQGHTWEPMRLVCDAGPDTCGNPCPIVDRQTGVVWLLQTRNKGDVAENKILHGEAPARTVWVGKSEDDGVTWPAPIEISEQVREPDWRWYATGPCHGIQLRDGTLVAPCDHALGPQPESLHSHVIFSPDHGATWRIGGSSEGKTDESTVLELADGRLYLNMRNYRGTNLRAYSFSADQGMTWSPVAEDPALIDPTCQASVLRLSTEPKFRALFSNPASKKRENMTVRLSYDECKTWPVAKPLHTGPAAYSDLVSLDDKTIGCLYERGNTSAYERITWAQFTLAWLTDGKDDL